MTSRLVIAIDGPAGSGKSTTAKQVARRLGLGYLDTGAMYRAVTLAFLDSGVSPDDPDAVARATREAAIDISLDPDDYWVRVNGRDVTGEIRTGRVTEHASVVSTNPDCRADLVARQRALMDADPRGGVAEGRDITTVVYPDAPVRVLLTASPEARLARRRGDVGASVSAEQLRTQVLSRDAADSKLVEFQKPAEGVRLLDTTDLTLDEVVATIVGYAEEARPVTDDFTAPEGDDDLTLKPVVAVVGRPNVGKSALVNRIIGRREAVVQDLPGVTRDRVSYDATWGGREFVVVDTGGWISDAKGMAARIAEQAELAIEASDAVLFVVDATVGITDEDEAVVRVLRQSRKPVVLAANKVDDQRTEAEAASMWNLGLGEPFPVSALHGRGSGDLLDAVLAVLPDAPQERYEAVGGPRRVAIVGKPNVGKSSLLNRLTGQQRSVVDNVAGTTVDPVDELVELGGEVYRFIDTAGLRRRVKEASGHEYYASLRTQGAVERSEVCVVVLDAAEPISDQDLKILSMVEDAGKALVIAYNKWDLTDDERRRYLNREIEQDIQAFRWAPSVNISALSGRNVDKLKKAIDAALEGWETRVTTGQLNSFLGRVAAAHPHPVRSGKQPRILFGTQAQNCPPTFVLFTSGMMDPQYLRFVERRLREEFGFVGTPVHVELKAREKRAKK